MYINDCCVANILIFFLKKIRKINIYPNSQQQGSGASCPPINQETNTVLPPRITGYVALKSEVQ
jgi:hypothetical protein